MLHPDHSSDTDFNQSPFLTIWETTQACDLVCSHCRAAAQPLPLPGELSTEEGKVLLSSIKAMGCKIVVLTGGDPMKRTDLCELIRHGAGLGLRMATIPAATPHLCEEHIMALKAAGVAQVAFSLDFPIEHLHDEFRGVPGAYAKTMAAIEWVKKTGVPVQINTVITKNSLPYFKQMTDLAESKGIAFWEVFFLVPMGRGEALDFLSPEEVEQAFELLYDIQKRAKFVLKVTEAPHYRRFVAQKENVASGMPQTLWRSEGPGGGIGTARMGVNAGNGFLFVSYDGQVFPSGFLPVAAGNVRQRDVAEIYRNTRLFKVLRNPDMLMGKCSYCDYRSICGGSRSRAYAITGNVMGEEPWCAYDPPEQT